jgi:hypothetical protein
MKVLVASFILVSILALGTLLTVALSPPVGPPTKSTVSVDLSPRVKALEDRVTALEIWAQREGMKR